MDMPDGTYHILKRGEEMSGGVMAQNNGSMPSNWLVWINVTNVDDTLSAAQQNDGKVIQPVFEIPNIGRMGIIQDPAGGVLGVITPDS